MSKRPADDAGNGADKRSKRDPEATDNTGTSPSKYMGGEIRAFLKAVHLSHLYYLFEKNKVNMDCLKRFKHHDLQAIGIDEYGTRFDILTELDKLKGLASNPPELLVDLSEDKNEFQLVNTLMQGSIKQHKGDAGGNFERYQLSKVQEVHNAKSRKRYEEQRKWIEEDNAGAANERLLFHGGNVTEIVNNGFDVRKATPDAYFGAGLYFAESSSKSNQYAYGGIGVPCPEHELQSCYDCERQILICKVLLGNSLERTEKFNQPHGPEEHHSITGIPSDDGLKFYEFVVFKSEQADPAYLVTYKILEPANADESALD